MPMILLLLVALLIPAYDEPSTTGPLNIELAIYENNHDPATGAHEPIITRWSGAYTVGAMTPIVVVSVEYPIGNVIGAIEPAGLTTPGLHDSWLSGGIPVPPEGCYRVNLYIGGVLDKSVDSACGVLPPTHIDPPVVLWQRLPAPIML